jgi:uncharacterized membrane protein YdbT with pleckstrin-like domain
VEPPAGEEVFFHGHPSWRSIVSFYAKGLVIAVVVGVLAGVITDVSSNRVKVLWVVVAVLVVFVIVTVWGFLARLRTTYTITDRRLTIHIGLLSREMHETRLERVQNVNTRQSFVDRLLKVGAVDFDTAAEAGYDFTFHGVSHPQAIVRTVDRAIHELQEHQGGEAQRPSGV